MQDHQTRTHPARSGTLGRPARLLRDWWQALIGVVVCALLGLVSLGIMIDQLPRDLDVLPESEAIGLTLLVLVDVGAGLLALGLVPLLLGPSAAQRQRGLFAGVGIIAASAISSTAAPAALLALVMIASRLRHRWTAAASGLTLIAAVLNELRLPGRGLTSLLEASVVLPVIVIVVLIGLYLGSRRQTLESYRRQAESSAREKAALADQARQAERTRIAREMHDTLSHRLSLIALHAGGLAYHPDADTETVRTTSELIRATAQQANEELHGVLTLLREDPADREQPATLEDLDRVLAGFRRGGLTVETEIDERTRAELSRLSGPASTTLMRVLHESLANVVKHAAGQPARVRLSADRDGVQLSVRNRPGVSSAAAGGYGLIGVTERVHHVGGRFRAAPDGPDWLVTAWVPWT